MSYQPQVQETIKDEAEVVGQAENCQFSAFTLESLDRWVGELGVPDIVHWNNGLHDVGHNPNRNPVQYTVDAFLDNLKAIHEKLADFHAKIVWATLTPIHTDRPFYTDSCGWRNDEIDRFNVAATGLMNELGVPINDLHKIVSADQDRFLSEDMLHLSAEGQIVCRDAVVEAVRSLM